MYFTTAYFHLPAELGDEAREAGLAVDAVLARGRSGLDDAGPGGALGRREPRAGSSWISSGGIEADPAVLGMSAHLLLVARKA